MIKKSKPFANKTLLTQTFFIYDIVSCPGTPNSNGFGPQNHGLFPKKPWSKNGNLIPELSRAIFHEIYEWIKTLFLISISY